MNSVRQTYAGANDWRRVLRPEEVTDSEACNGEQGGSGPHPKARNQSAWSGATGCRLRQPSQLQADIVARLPAVLWVLCQADADHVLQPGWGHRFDCADGLRVFLQDRGHHADATLAVEGAPAGGHFVQHGAKRKDIAAAIAKPTFELLRSHWNVPTILPSAVSGL